MSTPGLSTWLEDRQRLESMKPDELTEEERGLRSLPITLIQTMPSVFQPRVHGTGNLAAAETMEVLKSALEKKGNLKPVKVWKRGGIWWLVDGHHRLKVYQEAEGRTLIPVKILRGSLDEVLRDARQENGEHKNNLTREDRAEIAWQEVLRGRLSVKEIVEDSLIGERTVHRMKATLRRLQECDPRQKWEGWTWADVLRHKKELVGTHTPNGQWEARQISELQDRVVSVLKTFPKDKPFWVGKALWRAYGEVFNQPIEVFKTEERKGELERRQALGPEGFPYQDASDF